MVNMLRLSLGRLEDPYTRTLFDGWQIAHQPGYFAGIANDLFLLEAADGTRIAIVVFAAGEDVSELTEDDLDNFEYDRQNFSFYPQLVNAVAKSVFSYLKEQ